MTAARPAAGRMRAGSYTLDLVTHLVGREFKLRYRRALLGWAWAVAEPLVRFGVLAFVFTVVLPLGIPDYPAHLFTGIMAWSWFSSGIASATSSAVDRRELFLRPELPRAVVPTVSVLTDGLDYLAALPILAAFLLLGDGIPVTALALPIVLATQLLLTLGLGFAQCAANVYLRDVRLMVTVGLTAAFYLTPVFYAAESVPEPYRALIALNPVARLLAVYRDILVEGRLPQAGAFLALIAACGTVFALGYAIYRRVAPSFLDEL